MRQTELFTKTLKDISGDETSVNARLLERAGFIYKNLAGVYSFLPLGFRVLQKIIEIIRQEMNGLGANELFLNTLQSPAVWEKTDRWSQKAIEVWFRTELQSGGQLGLATTHEEPLTEIMSHYISSYKDLPVYVYQFQTKFRNELRVKGGLLRVREFVMKDLYSFTRTQEELDVFYEKCAQAYLKIFRRVGLGEQTYRTFASGGAFSKFSDEFQTICESGEDTVYVDRKKKIAVNREVYQDEVLKELKLDKKALEEVRAIEVGNIFKLGTRYSKPLGLMFADKHGEKKPVVMGSYGIGPGRVMGAVVEVHHDERGIVWPSAIAPFELHLLGLTSRGGESVVLKAAERLFQTLQNERVEVLYDDRDETAGVKFADSDLIGAPYRAVVSEKTVKQGKIELKKRNEDAVKFLTASQLVKALKTPKA